MVLYALLPLLRDHSIRRLHKEKVLQILEHILEKCSHLFESGKAFSNPRFMELFHLFVEQIAPPKGEMKQQQEKPSAHREENNHELQVFKGVPAHEDLKLHATKCLFALLSYPQSPEMDSDEAQFSSPQQVDIYFNIHRHSSSSTPFIDSNSKSALALSGYCIALLIDEATAAVNRELKGTETLTRSAVWLI